MQTGEEMEAREKVPWLSELDSPLLTDLYQLTMLQAYVAREMNGEAVFEFFVRRLPPQRNFLLAAGLEQLLDFLETVRFSECELSWLGANGHADDELIEYLRDFHFSGDVYAVPEGTVVFANEPIVRVVAPLPQAQLVESRLVNLLNFQTIIASKAARSVLAAPERLLVDFGMRRAHGAEAALLAARAAFVAGFQGTATVLAGRLFEIPLYGTMAHSFVQAHDAEKEAFEAFARSQAENVVLLIDTYDTVRGAQKVVELIPRLSESGIAVRAVRLDSGDLITLSNAVRSILDAGGAPDVRIFASGGLNEYELERIVTAGAPIDGFGIGTDLDVSTDAPYLDCAYKLQEYDERARRKRSTGKATWPGRKQIFRKFRTDGMFREDTVGLETESCADIGLMLPAMRFGRRLQTSESLSTIRERAQLSLASLPAPLRSLSEHSEYPVIISPTVRALAADVDARMP
jgi:nicotinate phosphoribosyltransferase